jgi:hypothetical protein
MNGAYHTFFPADAVDEKKAAFGARRTVGLCGERLGYLRSPVAHDEEDARTGCKRRADRDFDQCRAG